MALLTIEPDEDTLHGFFDASHPPVLMIDPGDTVRFRTLDAMWGLEPYPRDRPPFDAEGCQSRRTAVSRHPQSHGHALCGPVFVRGAQPGMHLAVRVDALRPGLYGTTFAHDAEEGWTTLFWAIDADAGIATDQHGHRVAIRPFMGVMGNAPAEAGRHSTTPPRQVGGNLDCKELVVGSTLYLPIEVEGALFATGDGHARQGDGEVSNTAIECPMERCELHFELRDDLPTGQVFAETAIGWLAFGFDEDLGTAARAAVTAMQSLMAQRLGVRSRAEALALASVLVDLRVTQIANGVHGVHAVLPYDALG
jgi:acetamidase/formamidase